MLVACGPPHPQPCMLQGSPCLCPSKVGLTSRILLGGTLCVARAAATLAMVVLELFNLM